MRAAPNSPAGDVCTIHIPPAFPGIRRDITTSTPTRNRCVPERRRFLMPKQGRDSHSRSLTAVIADGVFVPRPAAGRAPGERLAGRLEHLSVRHALGRHPPAGRRPPVGKRTATGPGTA
ncbi:hypothetical protein GCM10010505_15420 [Kitasatospora aburaviensis]